MSDQRMAGQIWAQYNADERGKRGFDNEDLKYMQGEDWSNNDILKAAVASGYVHNGANEQLFKLNRQPMQSTDMPGNTAWQLAGKPGGYSTAKDFIFTGGDENDPDNYRVNSSAGDHYSMTIKGQTVPVYNFGYENPENFKDATGQTESGKDSAVLTWGGTSGSGVPGALSGYKMQQHGNDKYRRKDITWTLPGSYSRSQPDQDKDPKEDQSPPKITDPTQRFDASEYMSPSITPPETKYYGEQGGPGSHWLHRWDQGGSQPDDNTNTSNNGTSEREDATSFLGPYARFIKGRSKWA